MGESRESHSIFLHLKLAVKYWQKYHLKKAWYCIVNWDKLTTEDTFNPFICRIKGHIKYQPDPEGEPESWACERCHRYVK